MRQNLFLFFLLCVFSFSYGQNNRSSTIESKISFQKSNKAVNQSSPFTITSKDTFYIDKPNPIDVSYFLKIYKQDPELFKKYSTAIFYYSRKSSSTVYRLMQWKKPIVIYFDRSIPKSIVKKIRTFLKQLENIDNLTIGFTKDLSKSNYWVQLTNKEISVDPSIYGIKEEKERQNFVFKNCNYSIITDNNSGIIGCKLNLNESELLNEDLCFTKLKQAVFLSLGRFFMHNKVDSRQSFLSPIYDDQNVISEMDLEILRMHYSYIFDQRIDSTDFYNLLRESTD